MSPVVIGKKPSITYIANAGVLIEYKGKKILIDGLHLTFVKPYSTVPDSLIKRIVMGSEPFDKIDILMFTHHHLEHFDAYTVCEVLKRNRYTQLVGTPIITKMLQEAPNYDPVIQAQIKSIEVPLGKSIAMALKDVPFEIIALPHDGEKYKDVENYAYYFELGGRTFLHVGDAAASIVAFQNADIFKKPIDILLVTFPYITLSAGRKIVDAIHPRQVVIMHLPDKKYDSQNWLYNTFKAYKKYEDELPEVQFLTKIADTFEVS